MTDTKAADHYWYARNCTKFQNKTGHLSLMEMGAYDRLLDWYYLNRKPIPDDWVQMHRICRAVAPDEQAAVQGVVREFFTLTPDGWRNKTADEEIAKAQGISQKRREAQLEKERKRIAKEGANAPANAPTDTVTDTMVGVSKDTPTAASVPEVNMHFENIWNSYPGRGKNGATGAAYKGEKKTARTRFDTIYRNTKEDQREALVRNIIEGAGRYAAFIDRADYPSKHLSTWLSAAGWETDYGVSVAPTTDAGRRTENSLEAIHDKVLGDQTYRHLRGGERPEADSVGSRPGDVRGGDVLDHPPAGTLPED